MALAIIRLIFLWISWMTGYLEKELTSGVMPKNPKNKRKMPENIEK
jgi:hypothetical protein